MRRTDTCEGVNDDSHDEVEVDLRNYDLEDAEEDVACGRITTPSRTTPVIRVPPRLNYALIRLVLFTLEQDLMLPTRLKHDIVPGLAAAAPEQGHERTVKVTEIRMFAQLSFDALDWVQIDLCKKLHRNCCKHEEYDDEEDTK